MTNALSTLKEKMKASLVCCGLDPDWSKILAATQSESRVSRVAVLNFLMEVINVVAPHVCAFKPQKAFFDLIPDGYSVLKEVIAYIHHHFSGIPVIVDCKVGDIDNTMNAYLNSVFGCLEADGIVVNPYMGDDVILPCTKYPDKIIVVLVKTSNPNGAVVQDVKLSSGERLWEHVLELVVERWNAARNMVPVISSTACLDMQTTVRARIPDDMPVLLAGVGTQGGRHDSIRYLLDSRQSGVFVNSSRAILYPNRTPNETWQQATERAVMELKNSLNRERRL
jgi:orotidine-5'-phosphate decarboxylase